MSTENPDFGTPELQGRGIIILGPKDKPTQQIAKRSDQRRIDTMHRRNSVTVEQYDAACRFFKDAFHAGVCPNVKSSCNFSIAGNGDLTDHFDAKDRFKRAEKTLKGYERSLIYWVILDDKPIKTISPIRLFQEQAMEIFKDALDKLAIFYGIITRRK